MLNGKKYAGRGRLKDSYSQILKWLSLSFIIADRIHIFICLMHLYLYLFNASLVVSVRIKRHAIAIASAA